MSAAARAAILPALARRYPHATRIGIDFAAPLLTLAQQQSSFMQRLLANRRVPRLICADAETLPLQRASVQMVWSNLMLNRLH